MAAGQLKQVDNTTLAPVVVVPPIYVCVQTHNQLHVLSQTE
jgi:hypothetical protein